jgi:DNA replication and repair protein RecF
VHLSSIILHNFRNYSNIELTFHSSGAVIVGANGSGKTNLIEAIHLLCTGRSQRGASRRTMIQNGNSTAFARAHFIDDSDVSSSIQLGFSRDNKLAIKVNDVKVSAMSQWFGRGKVVPFGPPDLLLVQGSPAERRKFMDIVLSQADSAYLENLLQYKKALLCRNSLLCRHASVEEIELYEEQMGKFGMVLMQKRSQFFMGISDEFSQLYSLINDERSGAQITYRPSFAAFRSNASIGAQEFINAIAQRRSKDRELSYSSVGPHRDDFSCSIKQGRASLFASQGQCRALAIALRLCSLSYLENASAASALILLVDDALCELDEQRASRVYPLIRNKGQIFITSTSSNISYAEELETIELSSMHAGVTL